MGANTLANIEQECGGSIARGLKPFLHIARRDDVTSIPAATNMVVSTNMVMSSSPAGTFKKFAVSTVITKNSFKVEQVGDADSINYKITATYKIAGVTPAKMQILSGVPGCEFILICPDKNGNKWLVGDVDDGATVTWVADIGGEDNSYTLTVEWNTSHPPYNYTGTITAA